MAKRRSAEGKGVDLTGLLGDTKEDWGSGNGSPQKMNIFVKLHIIFALKHNKQQLLLLLDSLNNITSKILGGHVPLSHRDRRGLGLGAYSPPPKKNEI